MFVLFRINRSPPGAGCVMDRQGKPVSGVQVSLYSITPYTACSLVFMQSCETGSNGRFRFTLSETPRPKGGWRPERRLLVASKQGYAIGWTHIDPATRERVSIVLGNPGSLSGRVVTESGAPVFNADVRAVLSKDGAQDLEYVVGSTFLCSLIAKTDSNGRFVVGNVPENATADFLVAAPGKTSVNTMSQPPEHPLHFRPGGDGAEIVLKDEAVVAGVVLEKQSGKPVEGARVQIQLVDDLMLWFEVMSTASDAEGRFCFRGLREAQYCLGVVSEAPSPPFWVGLGPDVTTTAGETRDDIVLEVEKAGKVSVTVNYRYGREPAAPVIVGFRKAGQLPVCTCDTNGQYVCLAPGRYTVHVGGEGVGYDDLPDPLVVKEGVVTDIVITMDPSMDLPFFTPPAMEVKDRN
ncbi:MAG: MSCRAMM family protein [Planctomycetota bacterium]|jgi:5-hydroxyisourate hydrolase-like protein (transthyretin family)